MPSQGPATGTLSNQDVGGVDWSAMKGGRFVDNITHGQQSDRLIANNFGFTIPGTASIVGIAASITRYASTSSGPQHIRDTVVQLIPDGVTPDGDNKADTTLNWPNTSTAKSYGGSTDLWGLTFTPAEINDAAFAIYLRIAATDSTFPGDDNFDAIVTSFTLTVHYADAGGTYTASATLTLPGIGFAGTGDNVDASVFAGSAALILPPIEMAASGLSSRPDGSNLTRWLDDESFAFGGSF